MGHESRGSKQVKKKRCFTAVIADENELIREGIKAVLCKTYDVEILAETKSGKDAVSLILKYRPDIAFIDIKLQDLPGLESIQAVNMAVPCRC